MVVLGYRGNTLKVPPSFNFMLGIRKDGNYSFIMMPKISPVDATFLSIPVLNDKNITMYDIEGLTDEQLMLQSICA